jgi:hypothetical protein
MLAHSPMVVDRLNDVERMIQQAQKLQPNDPWFQDLIQRSIRLLEEVKSLSTPKDEP